MNKGFVVKSKRYWDIKEEDKKSEKKKLKLIVIDGIMDSSFKESIIKYFYNKWSTEGHHVLIPKAPKELAAKQFNSADYIVATVHKTIKWFRNEIKPYLKRNFIVILDYYYHKHETLMLLLAIQQAQYQRQLASKQPNQIKKNTPLEVDMRPVYELQKITRQLPKPDIMFSFFNYQDIKTKSVYKAFSELFRTESYNYMMNTFYGVENVIKEMEVRLKKYSLEDFPKNT